MGKLEKHLGLGEPVKIGDDEVILKPLTIEYLPEFFKMERASSRGEKVLDSMTEDEVKAVQRIIEATIDKSFPDETEEARKEFGLRYRGTLIGEIMRINSGSKGKDKADNLIEKAKEAAKKG